MHKTKRKPTLIGNNNDHMIDRVFSLDRPKIKDQHPSKKELISLKQRFKSKNDIME